MSLEFKERRKHVHTLGFFVRWDSFSLVVFISSSFLLSLIPKASLSKKCSLVMRSPKSHFFPSVLKYVIYSTVLFGILRFSCIWYFHKTCQHFAIWMTSVACLECIFIRKDSILSGVRHISEHSKSGVRGSSQVIRITTVINVQPKVFKYSEFLIYFFKDNLQRRLTLGSDLNHGGIRIVWHVKEERLVVEGGAREKNTWENFP